MRVVSSFSRVRISMDSFFCMNFHLLVYVSYQAAMLRGWQVRNVSEKRLRRARRYRVLPPARPDRYALSADHCATP
jgi:hypothetical protein